MNSKSNKINRKILILSKLGMMLIISLVVSLIMSVIVSASLLDLKACNSDWYCTQYDKNTCGLRSCIDINSCTSKKGIPAEYLECQNISVGQIGGNYPDGYFKANPELAVINIEQDEVSQKIIEINSSMPDQYNLEIEYPSTYTLGTEFLTTSSKTKNIESSGEFNIMVDSRSIRPGTYVIPLRVYNSKQSKIVTAVVNILQKNNHIKSFTVDSKIKNLAADKQISIEINTDDKVRSGDGITYEIFDSEGNTVVTEERTVETPGNIIDSVSLPTNNIEGYYILTADIKTGSEESIQSATFTILNMSKYSKVIDLEKDSRDRTTLITIIVIIVVIAGTNIIIYGIYSRKRKRMFIRSNSAKFREATWSGFKSWSRLNAEIIAKGFNKLFNKSFNKYRVEEKKRQLTTNEKIALLKECFEHGFISLKEYTNLLKKQGYSVDDTSRTQKPQHVMSESLRTSMTDNNTIVERKQLEKDKKELKEENKKERTERQEEKKEIEKEIKKELKQLEVEKSIMKEEIKEIVKEELKEMREDTKEDVSVISNAISAPKEKRERIVSETVETPPGTAETFDRIALQPLTNLITKSSILEKRADDDKTFVLSNGQRLFSLGELLDSLRDMPEYVFYHHTKRGRNDFSNWVGDVFHYYDVADDIRNSETKEDLIKILEVYR